MKVQRIVGVTGGIGAGKSVVCRIFRAMGYPVFYSDQVAKEILNEDKSVRQAIINLFGTEAYIDGGYHRQYIAQQVFQDNQLLSQLNQIVHPAVRNAFAIWQDQQNAPILLNEAAILFETGMYKNYDAMILVTAPVDIRIKRVMNRDQVTAEEVKKRMEKQWPDEKKQALADYIIVNDGVEMLIPQVIEVVSKLLKT